MSDPSTNAPLQRFSTVKAELSKKPVELAIFATAVTTTGVFAAVNLALSRYLAVFGQPGLIASVDGLSPALIRSLGFLFAVTLLLTSTMITAPLFSRHLIRRAGGYPLAAGFDWPNVVDGPRWSSLIAYLVAHGPLVSLLGYYVLASLFPAQVNHQVWVIAAYLIGLIPSLLFVLFGRAKDRKAETYVDAVLTTSQLGLFAFSWFATVLVLFGDPSVAANGQFSWGAAAKLTSLCLAILAAHWFVTVISTHLWASLTFSLAVLLIVLVAVPGDLAITYNVLRLAGVGGGVPMTFRDPKAAPGTAPRTACLILSTGDLRVVKLAPKPADCDAVAMRRLFFKLRDEGAEARALDLAMVRVVKRETFVDVLTPADVALEPPSPPKPAATAPKTP